MKRKTSLPVSYRLAVTSRVLAAVVGGYLLASLASVCMTLWLPTRRADAVISGMLGSFVFYLLAGSGVSPAVPPGAPGLVCCCPVRCWPHLPG